MMLSEIKQTVGHIESYLGDNLALAMIIGVAVGLAVLILGGMLLDVFLQWKKERDKAKAFERLRKHLDSLPSVKS